MPLPSLSDLKTHLGLTGSGDDTLLASIVANAPAIAERDTGRYLSVRSNVTTRYSTDAQTAITIHDRPYTDSTRVVSLSGVTRTEGTDVWLLPDRRNPDVVTWAQMRHFDTGIPGWYRSDPQWFDRNLDRPYRGGAAPNDLVITGTVGHGTVTGDTYLAILELEAWLYWRAKGGVSSFAETLNGTDVDLSSTPAVYQEWVRDWTLRTAVAVVP